MQRLQIADAKMMEIALKNEILRSEEARYDHRLHGVLLVVRDSPVMTWGRCLAIIPRPSSDGCEILKCTDSAAWKTRRRWDVLNA